MKQSNILRISLLNFGCKISHYITVICCLTFVAAVSLITVIIRDAIGNYYNEMIYGDMVGCKLSFRVDAAQQPASDETFQAVSALENLSAPSVSSILDVPQNSGHPGEQYISLSRVTLQTESGSYTGTDDHSSNYAGNYRHHVSLGVRYVCAETAAFDAAEQTAFSVFYPGSPLMTAGSIPEHDHEIAVSDYLLSHFGITDPAALIGQEISLLIDGVPYLTGYRLTGAVNADVFTLHPKDDVLLAAANPERYSAQVIAVGTPEDLCALGGTEWEAAFYPEPLDSISGIPAQLREQNLREAVSFRELVCDTYKFMFQIRQMSGFILTLLLLFVCAAMGMLIVSITADDIQRQTGYQAMMRAVGIKRRSLFGIVLTEHLISLLFALVLSGGISVLFLIASNAAFRAMFGDGITVTAAQFRSGCLLMFPLISAVYLLLIAVIFLRQHSKTICALLRQ